MRPPSIAPRRFLAPNPGPFTFDGTWSYVVGGDDGGAAAVIDPGPSDEAHLSVLAEAVADASRAVVLVTHDHADHAAGARELAHRTGAPLADLEAVRDGQVFPTSAGPLVAVSTPGHARRHFCFHLPRQGAVFTGDLVLGRGDTTWVGEYRGGVADYLASLDRLEALDARVFYPGHGDPLRDPKEVVGRFRRHRLERIEQVREALAQGGARDPRSVTLRVYGPLPPVVFDMAVEGVEGILDYLSAAK